MQITDTQFQELEDDVQKIHTSLDSVSKDIKEISNNVQDWENFQLKEPLDAFSLQLISDQISVPISVIYQGSTAATATNYDHIFIANRSYIIDSIMISYSSASSSGTFKVVRTPSGTAVASGIDVMTATISTAATANINYTATLKSADMIVLRQGDRLGIISGGTLTGLANLVVTIILKQK